MFFAPKWKKEAKLLHKSALKFLHYKRDLLKPDRIDEIESRRSDLLDAIKADDKVKAEEASKQLRATCEGALPHFPAQSAWEENVEVIFVALVVALGLRAYIIQPFRIPTGSMQPTLNGINIHESKDPDFKKPWLGQQAWEMVTRGRSYQNVVAESNAQVVGIRDASWFLFTRTRVLFSDGKQLSIPAAEGEAQRLLEARVMQDRSGNPVVDPNTGFKVAQGKTYAKGDPILRGWVDTGDLVLVDKISYHFRKPKRGEVFVFDTRGIKTGGSKQMADQTGGTHFIKRLCGVPGDDLSVKPPNLWVNGKIAQEFGIQRVIQAQGEYGKLNPNGYELARMDTNYPLPLSKPDETFHLAAEARPGMREYAALGDNTGNSLDSRYWGSVKEFNLAGPALFSLWPITTGHWGFIH
ncbi:signal peptidase I [Luteolibacter soli]|uniref:Signal peptidase I n=1 Tax=Luteolibacter soli TaxID=3135280 RepID=A0ABU9AT39_9BACT